MTAQKPLYNQESENEIGEIMVIVALIIFVVLAALTYFGAPSPEDMERWWNKFKK